MHRCRRSAPSRKAQTTDYREFLRVEHLSASGAYASGNRSESELSEEALLRETKATQSR